MKKIHPRPLKIHAFCLTILLSTSHLALAQVNFDWVEESASKRAARHGTDVLADISDSITAQGYQELQKDPILYGKVLAKALEVTAEYKDMIRPKANLLARLQRLIEGAPPVLWTPDLVEHLRRFDTALRDKVETLQAQPLQHVIAAHLPKLMSALGVGAERAVAGPSLPDPHRAVAVVPQSQTPVRAPDPQTSRAIATSSATTSSARAVAPTPVSSAAAAVPVAALRRSFSSMPDVSARPTGYLFSSLAKRSAPTPIPAAAASSSPTASSHAMSASSSASTASAPSALSTGSFTSRMTHVNAGPGSLFAATRSMAPTTAPVHDVGVSAPSAAPTLAAGSRGMDAWRLEVDKAKAELDQVWERIYKRTDKEGVGRAEAQSWLQAPANQDEPSVRELRIVLYNAQEEEAAAREQLTRLQAQGPRDQINLLLREAAALRARSGAAGGRGESILSWLYSPGRTVEETGEKQRIQGALAAARLEEGKILEQLDGQHVESKTVPIRTQSNIGFSDVGWAKPVGQLSPEEQDWLENPEILSKVAASLDELAQGSRAERIAKNKAGYARVLRRAMELAYDWENAIPAYPELVPQLVDGIVAIPEGERPEFLDLQNKEGGQTLRQALVTLARVNPDFRQALISNGLGNLVRDDARIRQTLESIYGEAALRYQTQPRQYVQLLENALKVQRDQGPYMTDEERTTLERRIERLVQSAPPAAQKAVNRLTKVIPEDNARVALLQARRAEWLALLPDLPMTPEEAEAKYRADPESYIQNLRKGVDLWQQIEPSVSNREHTEMIWRLLSLPEAMKQRSRIQEILRNPKIAQELSDIESMGREVAQLLHELPVDYLEVVQKVWGEESDRERRIALYENALNKVISIIKKQGPLLSDEEVEALTLRLLAPTDLQRMKLKNAKLNQAIPELRKHNKVVDQTIHQAFLRAREILRSSPHVDDLRKLGDYLSPSEDLLISYDNRTNERRGRAYQAFKTKIDAVLRAEQSGDFTGLLGEFDAAYEVLQNYEDYQEMISEDARTRLETALQAAREAGLWLPAVG